VTGAIVIAEGENRENWPRQTPGSSSLNGLTQRECLAGVELLGMSVFARLIQHLTGTRTIADVSVVLDGRLPDFDWTHDPDVVIHATSDVWGVAREQLLDQRHRGLDPVLIIRTGAYIECDLDDLVGFHYRSGEAVTCVGDDRGALDFWVVNPHIAPADDDLRTTLEGAEACYRIPGYVNRLDSWWEMRRLVIDGLTLRCLFWPQGREVRPGVWMAEGAQLERGARIVAPGFIGRDVTISDQCLITRGTNVETGSYVDYGTVVEDSSILAGTYIGIGLDLSHSIAHGTHLAHLDHDVLLEITDPMVVRPMRGKHSRVAAISSSWPIGNHPKWRVGNRKPSGNT
jgi:hypothetical protein